MVIGRRMYYIYQRSLLSEDRALNRWTNIVCSLFLTRVSSLFGNTYNQVYADSLLLY